MITTQSTEAPAQARCLTCRRPIRAAESLATGYGAGCRAKFRKAARTADLSAWTPAQVAEARQAIEDGAVVPSTREGVYHVVSSDGSEVHRTSREGCNCANGLQVHPSRPCFHRCAVAIVLGAPAAPARPVLAIAAAPAPAASVWDALGAVGALDLIPAF